MKSTSLFTAPQDLRCNATLKDPKLLRAEGVKASFKPGTTSTPTASTLAEDPKALLGEVRQLRQDLQANAAMIQRVQIQEAEARERDAANPDARKAAATSLVQLKSELEALTGQEQECQMEQIEAGNQVRDTQARVNELLDQLDRFDKLFAAYLGK
jgi:chromosome segregation ATPase